MNEIMIIYKVMQTIISILLDFYCIGFIRLDILTEQTQELCLQGIKLNYVNIYWQTTG